MKPALTARVLESEVMDSLDEALDYNAMDHAAVNRTFVADLLAVAPELVQAPPAALPTAVTPGTFDFPPRDNLPEVLDLGTGTALIPIELCTQAEHCKVLAVDMAVAMLEIARYNLELRGQTSRIQLDLIDAKKLPYAAGRFAVVMSNSIVHHSPVPEVVLREAARVAAPGGLLFVRDLLRPNDEAQVETLVATYAAGATQNQRAMFAASLRAALSLAEIRALVGELDFDPATVHATSDRHWTWSLRLE